MFTFNFFDMKIKVNNREVMTDAQTLLTLMQELNMPDRGVAVAVNNGIVQRSDWGSYSLSENMKITIIKAACGG